VLDDDGINDAVDGEEPNGGSRTCVAVTWVM